MWVGGDNLLDTTRCRAAITEAVARQQHLSESLSRWQLGYPCLPLLCLQPPSQKKKSKLHKQSTLHPPTLPSCGRLPLVAAGGRRREVTPVHPAGSLCCGAVLGVQRWACCTWGRHIGPPATSPGTWQEGQEWKNSPTTLNSIKVQFTHLEIN